MAKRLNVQTPKSSFAELIKAHHATGGDVPVEIPLPAQKPRGKSANPEYVKLTSYIRKDTHLQVKRRLLDDGREISELVEELLGQWLTRTI